MGGSGIDGRSGIDGWVRDRWVGQGKMGGSGIDGRSGIDG